MTADLESLSRQLAFIQERMDLKLDALSKDMRANWTVLSERQTTLQELITEGLVGVRNAQHAFTQAGSERERRLRDVEEATRNLPQRLSGFDGRIDANREQITKWKAQVAVIAALFTAAGAAGAAGVMRAFGG